MENSMLEKHHSPNEKISPTAWPIAYSRTFTDIPYSQDILDELKNIKTNKDEVNKIDEKIHIWLTPQFEARSKVIDKLIKEYGAKQILEIASGLSARGMIFTEDPEINFVELDLPAMMEDKRKIVKNILEKSNESIPPNLHLESGSAFSMQDLNKATECFKKEPIAIINEGLLRYLNFDEKKIVANNVRSLLKKYGGVWITPDISTRRIIDEDEEEIKNKIEIFSKIIGTDFKDNIFKDSDEAQHFFEDLGFTVERRNFTEVKDQLVSPDRLNLPEDYVQEIIGSAIVFVMKVK